MKCTVCGREYDTGFNYMCKDCYKQTQKDKDLFEEQPDGQIKAVLKENNNLKRPK